MIIESIELNNYRNYKEICLHLNSGTNILYGDNAQGKTNLLEAIYVGCTTKSHRGTKDRDIIKFGESESHIKIIILRNDIRRRIDMHLKSNRAKGIAIDGIPIKKASELFGIVNIVFFSPEDLSIIKNGPSERRRFIDIELCQLDKIYLFYLSNYNKAVIQRNKLLKDLSYDTKDFELLEAWDLQLIKYGKKIIRARENFIYQLNDIIIEIHKNLSGSKERLEINYEPNVLCENFEKDLRKSRDRDLRQKMTLTGPHRDDISFHINEIDIRKFGSQGQQRTAALSLKLAEIEIVKKLIKDHPILLLDDVLSELDSSRQNQLLSGIKDIQTVITCTGLEDFISDRFHIDHIFKVLDDKIISEN